MSSVHTYEHIFKIVSPLNPLCRSYTHMMSCLHTYIHYEQSAHSSRSLAHIRIQCLLCTHTYIRTVSALKPLSRSYQHVMSCLHTYIHMNSQRTQAALSLISACDVLVASLVGSGHEPTVLLMRENGVRIHTVNCWFFIIVKHISRDVC
jgi:hypothetical protein